MPSKLDPHLPLIESWLAGEPQLTALAIVSRLTERDPEHFGPQQHSIVQRLLRKLRIKSAQQPIAEPASPTRETKKRTGPVSRACGRLGLSRARPVHSPLSR
jgi:hypothetical protein